MGEELQQAMDELGRAINALSPEEKEYLKEIQAQIDAVVEQDPTLDRRMEFCQALIFSPKDKLSSKRVINACKKYIKIVEGS